MEGTHLCQGALVGAGYRSFAEILRAAAPARRAGAALTRAILGAALAACAACSSGRSLSALASPPQQPKAFAGTSDSDLWGWWPSSSLTGNHFLPILGHFDGSGWSTVALPSGGSQFNASSGFPITAGATGKLWLMTPWTDTTDNTQHIVLEEIDAAGEIVHHGDDFPALSFAQSSNTGYATVSLGSHGGVVVAAVAVTGTSPTTKVIVYSGGNATHADAPHGVSFGGVFVAAADDVYGVTNLSSATVPTGSLFHFDGHAWTLLRTVPAVNEISIAPDGEAWLYAMNQFTLVTTGAQPMTVLHGRKGNLSEVAFSLPPPPAGTAQGSWNARDVVALSNSSAALIGEVTDADGNHVLAARDWQGGTLAGSDDDLTSASDCLGTGDCPQAAGFLTNLDDGDPLLVSQTTADDGTQTPTFYVLHRADL